MSGIVIAGDTSGTVTVNAPLVAGTSILTLPAVTGNVLASTAISASTTNTNTNKITINIGGVVYYLLASTSAT